MSCGCNSRTGRYCEEGERLRKAKHDAYEEVIDTAPDRMKSEVRAQMYETAERRHRAALQDWHQHLATASGNTGPVAPFAILAGEPATGVGTP